MPLPNRIRRSVSRQAQHLLETGQRFQRFDQIRQRHFWSDYLFVSDVNGYINSGNFKTFITPPGQQGQGFTTQLTDCETNWKSANRVPDNQNFEVLEVGVTIFSVPTNFGAGGIVTPPLAVFPPTPRLWNAFNQSTVLAIQYLTNEVSLGLCADFAQASGPVMGSYQPVIQENAAGGEFGYDSVPATGVQAFPDPAARRFATNGFAAPGLRRRFKIPLLLQHGETFSFNLIVPRTYFAGAPVMGAFIARIDFWATESFVEKS